MDLTCAHRCGISPVSKTCFFSFAHETAPFCEIDCVQAHPERGMFEFREMN
jgi:hypothetical protein